MLMSAPREAGESQEQERGAKHPEGGAGHWKWKQQAHGQGNSSMPSISFSLPRWAGPICGPRLGTHCHQGSHQIPWQQDTDLRVAAASAGW